MNPTTSDLDSPARRDLGALSLGTAAAFFGLPVLAQGAKQVTIKRPEEGLDYIRLEKPAATQAGKSGSEVQLKSKIEVVEFFWYGCPHCNAFEPKLDAWLKTLAKDVHFRRSPAAFRPEWVPQQQLYFTLEALQLVDTLHKKIFSAIHVKKLSLDTKEQIFAWLPKQAIQGLNMAKFAQTFDSFATASKATRATQLQHAYNVDGVPSLGVAGQFITDGAKAQSMERALKVVEALVNGQRNK